MDRLLVTLMDGWLDAFQMDQPFDSPRGQRTAVWLFCVDDSFGRCGWLVGWLVLIDARVARVR